MYLFAGFYIFFAIVHGNYLETLHEPFTNILWPEIHNSTNRILFSVFLIIQILIQLNVIGNDNNANLKVIHILYTVM